MDREEISNLCRGSSIDASYHRCFLPRFGSFGKAVSEEKIFRNRPIRNKNYLWQPYLLMDWDEMSNLYRGPSTRNRPIRNKNCLWRPCLIMNRDKLSSLYRGPSIDASYQVSVHLAKRFQRRRSFENNQ
jgi:hypothetical protein